MGRKEILKFQGKLAIKILKRTLVDKGQTVYSWLPAFIFSLPTLNAFQKNSTIHKASLMHETPSAEHFVIMLSK